MIGPMNVSITDILSSGDESVRIYLLHLICDDLDNEFACGMAHLSREEATCLALFLRDSTRALRLVPNANLRTARMN